MDKYSELMAGLGYSFSRPELLKLALRHPSLSGENNQRLEFLGDAVLQLAVSDILYAAYPAEHEGRLTAIRQHLVCEETLADIARDLGLDRYLEMDHGCRMNGVNLQDGALSDAMEAVLAAVYLDGGYEKAFPLIRRLWARPEPMEENAKSRLQELLQGMKKPVPEYRILKEEGPAHALRFTVAVCLDGEIYAQGSGSSKKRAEQAAAQQALQRLKDEVNP